MAKLWNYAVMITTMVVILEFLGIPTGLSSILNTLGVEINPQTSQLISADLQNSGFFSQIFGNGTGILMLIIGTGAGAIIVGLFAKSYDVSLVIAPFIVFIGTLYASTFWAIMLYVSDLEQLWMTYLIATIFIPLGVGFLISCVDYFKGEV